MAGKLSKKRAVLGRILPSAVLALGCTACAVHNDIPVGGASYVPVATAPAPASATTSGTYVIGPLDTVAVTVFREPQLSVEEAKVDPAGRIPVPLLGSIVAAGKTPEALEQEITTRLATYLVDPHVSVGVNSISQYISVEGTVAQPGVFDLKGANTSLLEALAMARSPTNVADLDQIYVFRRIDGTMQGARFDLHRIRAGVDPDPVILAGDRIVVGKNELAAAWLDYIQGPLYNVFRVVRFN